MAICRNCLIPMVEIMSFQPGERNRHDRYCRCPKCYREAQRRRLQKSLRNTSGGHGRAKKLKALDWSDDV